MEGNRPAGDRDPSQGSEGLGNQGSRRGGREAAETSLGFYTTQKKIGGHCRKTCTAIQ